MNAETFETGRMSEGEAVAPAQEVRNIVIAGGQQPQRSGASVD
jgi:hypothetical protein